MNIASLLEHWQITENPFRAEEARHDAVFARLNALANAHPDFEKIVGDLSRPSTAIVFGEKGSGKTAIRLQLAERIARANAASPKNKVLLVAYDDLNPALEQFCGVAQRSGKEPATSDTPARDTRRLSDRLREFKLVDHMDAILATAVPRALDVLLEGSGPDAPWKVLRKQPEGVKRDAQLLQALYDRHDTAEHRAAVLRQKLRIPGNPDRLLWSVLAYAGWLVPAAVVAASFYVPRDIIGVRLWLYLLGATILLWAGVVLKRAVLDPWSARRLARRVARHLRTVPRNIDALADTLSRVPSVDRPASTLTLDDSESVRYGMLERLRRLIRAAGYTGIIVVVDRVDEPTLVSGDIDRMRSIVWPLLSNKFLQQDGIGLKLLLPAELRHELFRESAAFFQEARLDKQNLIERLTWTGATLYDLCNARLRSCRPENAPPLTLADLFEDDVSRQDLVDALDQMRQPRDAFKLLYQCMAEHCSNITEDQAKWRIPRLVLETVRRFQSDRVQMLARGYRPA